MKDKLNIGCRNCGMKNQVYFIQVDPAEDSYYRCNNCGQEDENESYFLFIDKEPLITYGVEG